MNPADYCPLDGSIRTPIPGHPGCYRCPWCGQITDTTRKESA